MSTLTVRVYGLHCSYPFSFNSFAEDIKRVVSLFCCYFYDLVTFLHTIGLKRHVCLVPSYSLPLSHITSSSLSLSLLVTLSLSDMRVVFELVLNAMPVEKSAELWNRFVAFENVVGDVASVEKAEKRRIVALGLQGTQREEHT